MCLFLWVSVDVCLCDSLSLSLSVSLRGERFLFGHFGAFFDPLFPLLPHGAVRVKGLNWRL